MDSQTFVLKVVDSDCSINFLNDFIKENFPFKHGDKDIIQTERSNRDKKFGKIKFEKIGPISKKCVEPGGITFELSKDKKSFIFKFPYESFAGVFFKTGDIVSVEFDKNYLTIQQ